jgi:hypothetical protein
MEAAYAAIRNDKHSTRGEKINKMRVNYLFKMQTVAFLIYIFFFLLYSFLGYKESIPPFMMVLQLIYAFFYFFFLYCSYRFKLNIKIILVLIFLSLLVLSFVLRECYINFTSGPFGDDDNYYFYINNNIALGAARKDFSVLLQMVSKYPRFHYDDYGFIVISWLVFSITAEEYSSHLLLLLFQALILSLSTFYLYRILLFLNIKPVVARFFSAIWGFFPFFYLKAATQEKEIFFVFFILQAFYFMYKYKKRKNFFYLIVCIISAVICYFFRSLISILLILSIFIIMRKYKSKKTIFYIILIGAVLGFWATIILFNYIFYYLKRENFFETFVLANDRLSRLLGNIYFGWFIQIVAGLFGPFPNFNRAGTNEIMENSGLLLKQMLSLPLWIGVYQLFKDFAYKYYPILIYILASLLIIGIYGKTLDMRFQLTYFPAMLIVIAYAVQKWKNNIFYKLAFCTHTVFSICLIFLYNGR